MDNFATRRGRSPLRGRRHWWVGENLAWGTARLGRPSAIVAAWGARGWTYTADFGA